MGLRMTGEYSYDRDENLEALAADASHERRMDRQRHADAMYELAETGFCLDEDEEDDNEEGEEMASDTTVSGESGGGIGGKAGGSGISGHMFAFGDGEAFGHGLGGGGGDEKRMYTGKPKSGKEKVKIIQIMPDPQGGGILGLGSDGVVYGSNFSTWQIYLPAKFKDEEGGDA